MSSKEDISHDLVLSSPDPVSGAGGWGAGAEKAGAAEDAGGCGAATVTGGGVGALGAALVGIAAGIAAALTGAAGGGGGGGGVAAGGGGTGISFLENPGISKKSAIGFVASFGTNFFTSSRRSLDSKGFSQAVAL
jgi:hypothetical protein